MLKLYKKWFQTYPLRKWVGILGLLFSFLIIVFLIWQIFIFLDYIQTEYTFFNNTVAESEAQKPMLISILTIIMVINFGNLILMGYVLKQLFQEKNNCFNFFKVSTWLMILGIVLILIIIALQPDRVSKSATNESNIRYLIFLEKPSYVLAWLSFIMMVFISISGAVARRNFSYLRNDKHLLKMQKTITN